MAQGRYEKGGPKAALEVGDGLSAAYHFMRTPAPMTWTP